MLRQSYVNRRTGTGAVLTALSLLTNLLISTSPDLAVLRIGDLFLFIAVGALGYPAALLTGLGALLPEAIITQSFLPLRVLVLVGAISYVAKVKPKVPSYAVGLALWALIFWPSMFIINASYPLYPTNPGNTSHLIALTALSEILLLITSGALLLNKSLWSFLAQRPRQVSVEDMLIHVLPLVSTSVIFLTLICSQGTVAGFSAQSFIGESQGLLFLILVSILAPVVIGLRLGRVISRNFQEFTRTGLMVPATTFSGLSSDFWRKQAKSEESSLRIKTTTSSGLLTDGNLSLKVKTDFNNPDLGICSVNREGIVSFANRKFKNFAKIKDNNTVGKKLSSLGIPTPLASHLTKLIDDTFAKGARKTELKIVEPNQTLRYFEIGSAKSEGFENSAVAGGPDSILITMRDITDRRTVEAKLLKAHRLDSLGEFVSGSVRAFNNALTTICAEASLALSLRDKPSFDESLHKIITASKKAGTLAHQLIEFAEDRPERRSVVDLGEVLSGHLSLLQQGVGSGCEVTLTKSSDEMGISCDLAHITQALTNLLLNAKESYAEGAGKIDLLLDTEEIEDDISHLHIGAKPGRYARLRVRDYGVGMGPETLSRVFDPLFTTKSSKGNTGLGLSVVFAIVRAHDGFLTAESSPKKGTTISLYFPLRDLDESRASSGSAVLNPLSNIDLPKGKHEKILLVENDKPVNEIILKLLISLGYDVTTCVDTPQIIEQCKAQGFDLVLLDEAIPKVTASEVVEDLYESSPNTRVMILSGCKEMWDIPGVHEFLMKPFEVGSLAAKVRSALDQQVLH